MKRLVSWLAGWLALFWLWMLLAGEWNRQEWIAAAAAATVASVLVGRIALARVNVWTVPAMIVVDFGILMWALLLSGVQRRVVRGAFVRRPFRREGAGVRAWTGLAATYSPNAYLVGFDDEREVALLHDLMRNRGSERPV